MTRAALLKRAKKVRLFAMDVDGVLTDGGILILDSGEEVKVWNVKDRIAFAMLRMSGADFRLAWITGRKSRQVADRAKEVGVHALHQACLDKGRALAETAERFGLSPEETLFIGDDLVDLPALGLAGLSVCPSDAADEVKKAVHWVAKTPGGRGVFREAVDLVLKAQGLYGRVLADFAREKAQAPARGKVV
jgi:3-deoxy-D-manno-octulosonate 8-phosphate phosphatase (KDO 8-P phosphatase)